MNTQFRSMAVAASCALAGVIPATASAQGGDLGGAASIVTGTTDQVTSALDGVLGGVGGVLTEEALGDVLATVAGPGGEPGATGTPGASGGAGGTTTLVGSAPTGVTTMPSGGSSAADRRAPAASVKVVSRLAQVARTRRLRLQVRVDEAGVVAIAATMRPGVKRRGVAKRVKHRRSVIHPPTVVLAFRQAGTLTVDLRLGAGDAKRLGRSKNARMSIGLLTADVARNQASQRLKRHLRR